MIVKMKKVIVVVQKKDAQAALHALQSLGVVHPELEVKPLPEHLLELKHQTERIHSIIGILNKFQKSEVVFKDIDGNWTPKAEEILDLNGKLLQLKEQITKRQALIDKWSAWGSFDPQNLQDLFAQGIYVQLCEVPTKQLKKFAANGALEIITQDKTTTRCVLISREKVDTSFQVALPPMSLNRLNSLQNDDQKNVSEIEKKIESNVCYQKFFEATYQHCAQEVRFQETLYGMGEAEQLAYLKGFCPVDAVDKVQATAKKEQWGLLVEDPEEGDSVPTLLKNPKWIDMIKPVFSFMNSIPGYRELDVSFFFLIFLSIFFGILIGDAAYGILFLLFMAIAHKKFGKKVSNHGIFYLIYTMSVFAVIWGFLTGTFFGTKLFGSYIKPVMPWLTSNENVQLVCFVLGAIHLSIAHIWRALLRLNSVTALAEIGWLLTVWGCFFFTRMLILNEPLPNYINIFLYGGPALVILFNQPRKNILAGVGLGLGDFLLNVMSYFGDTVSYIRLFAVGLAGVSVADAFNQMALAAGFKNLAMGGLAIFVLLIGHTLNMILACFGVLVHGIRLNLLEFSAHLGMEWTGKEYDPLRKTS